MADVKDKAARSRNMAAIKSKNTKPEETVRKYLFSKGFRYRKNDTRLIGKPDIVLPKYKTVIFVNGCFWHGHDGCRYFVVPKTNTEFWINKLQGNKSRDASIQEELTRQNRKIITIWECELRRNHGTERLEKLCAEIVDGSINSPDQY